MPNASDRRNPHAIVLDTIPGERTHIVWDVANQTVEYAQVLARRIRAAGAIVVGCSLDELVTRGHVCPVCGAAGARK
jgi:hypothetical protein